MNQTTSAPPDRHRRRGTVAGTPRHAIVWMVALGLLLVLFGLARSPVATTPPGPMVLVRPPVVLVRPPAAAVNPAALGLASVVTLPASPVRPAAPARTAPADITAPGIAAPVQALITIRLGSGDTLWGLARTYHTTVAALQQLNGLGHSTLIYAGATLRVPASPTAATSTISISPAKANTSVTTTAAVRVASSGATPQVTGVAALQRIVADVFGSEYECAADVVGHESSWTINATNPVTGAYGLPQALPATKMASAGADWRTDPWTQLEWMRSYVDTHYGGACPAWEFWQAHGWY